MAGLPHEPDNRGRAGAEIDNGSTGAPRWVKVFEIIALIVALLVAIMLLTGIGGEHGPSRHNSRATIYTS